MINGQNRAISKLILATMSVIILLFTAMTASVLAAPLLNAPVTVTQPDGTTLDAFVSGDEFFNYLHDSEGRVILQHPETGFWVYAMLDANGVLTASNRVAVNDGRFYDANSLARMVQPISNHGITTSDIDFSRNSHLIRDMDMPVDVTPLDGGYIGFEPAGAGLGMMRATPISGTVENIVILITFACDPDPSITPSLSGVIENRFNAPQSSLRSYMHAASGGLLTLNSTLVGMNNSTIIMYQDPQPRGYFMPFNAVSNTIGYNPARIDVLDAPNTTEGHIRGQQLLARAVQAIDGSTLLNGLVLDNLLPLHVDSVTFILTGNPVGWGSFLWPHRWTLHLSPATLNGVTVNDYSLLMLGVDSPTYSLLSSSIIVHEQLHIFGMPDFYRYASPTRPAGDIGRPVSHWDIMASNSDILFQFSNTLVMRRYIGWGDPPVQITDSGTFTLHPLGTPNQTTAYVIPVQGRPNEFILLEYRSSLNPTAYDNFLAAASGDYRAGLVITRINTGFRGNARSGDPAFQGGYTGFRDEVYIFRPGTTARNVALGDVARASLSANSGRTSFGDAQGTGYYGIIYTQEGYNTGIEIYNVGVAGGTITFSVYLGGNNITSLSPEAALRAEVNAAVGSEPTIIYLTQDITLTERLEPLMIPSGANVILRGAGGVTRYISAGGNFAAIEIGTTMSSAHNTYLVLEDVGITRVPGTIGNGIIVRWRGHLTLTRGTISGHNRGAVRNYNIFIMDGGDVINNTAIGDAAGGVFNLATFTMRGGTISGNTGIAAGGVRNVVLNVDDVRIPGVFTMEGGTISYNTATGVNGGGGVSNIAIFNMKDGIISNNTASIGGGVTNMVAGTVFTMYDGIISGNSALGVPGNNGTGGGVLNMTSATFIMENGVITNNSTNGWGGGVTASGDNNINAPFIMRGGTISNNTGAGGGGGVAVLGVSTFNMESGTISGNVANSGSGIGIGMAALRAGRLTVGADTVFAYNTTPSGTGAQTRHSMDDAVYASHIHGTQWTYPFTQGFNNFDISYSAGFLVTIRQLHFVLGGTATNPTTPESLDAISVIAFTPITQARYFPANPTRVGYTFAGWYLNAWFSQPLTNDSNMPNNPTTRIYARWAIADFTVSGVTVSPSTASVTQDGTLTLNATVLGTGNPPQAVTWTVEGSVNPGTVISSDGVLTIASDEVATSLTVRATSVANTGVSGTAVITVLEVSGPTPIPMPTTSPMVSGYHHTLALRYDGTVWAWGCSSSGQLGDGIQVFDTFRYMPMQVQNLYDVVQVIGTASSSIILKSDGTIWSWGWNVPNPVQLVDLDNVISIAQGQAQTIALKSDGTIWSWGGHYVNSPQTPVQLEDLDNVIAIAAGGNHNLALRHDGTVWAWGSNHWGQLGNGTTSGGLVQVHGLNNVIAIDAGHEHSIALRSDGTVWAWGRNNVGQVCRFGSNRPSPTQVHGLSGITAISAGRLHNLALGSDGAVWGWGQNRSGEIGVGDTHNPPTVWAPMQIQGIDNVMHISASNGSHSIAVRYDGFVWAWGSNRRGQLGDGTTIERNIPIQVLGPHNGRLNLLPHLADAPTITGVTVSPPTSYVQLGGSRSFTALVEGINNPGQAGQAVTWAIEGSVNPGTAISADGVLTVAGDESATTLTVRATSIIDTGVSGTAITGVTGYVNSWVQLRDIINAAPEGIPTTIKIGSSFAAPDGIPGNVIEIPANRHITLVSSNTAEGTAYVRTLTQLNLRQHHFTVNANSNLTLCQGITLFGGGVHVNSGGEFIMDSGSVIERAGAVLINGSGINGDTHGRFTMRGGIIRYSLGGVDNRGYFIMYGGYIRDNNATSGGGVRNNNGTFVMYGGTIYNNFASAGGGGVLNNGVNATFTMHGGKIIGNSAEQSHTSSGGGVGGGGGVSNVHGIVTMYNGLIAGNRNNWAGGGGVSNASGTFIMNGGEISGNSAGRNGGGGVINSLPSVSGSGVFIMNGGKITGNWVDGSVNTTRGGGGIYNSHCGIFTMYGGEISGNTSNQRAGNTPGGRGGGVLNAGNFTMHDGKITGNSIFANLRYDGGGVYNRGYFTMYGGEISNNTRNSFGSSRDCNVANSHTFIIHGGVIICDRIGYI